MWRWWWRWWGSWRSCCSCSTRPWGWKKEKCCDENVTEWRSQTWFQPNLKKWEMVVEGCLCCRMYQIVLTSSTCRRRSVCSGSSSCRSVRSRCSSRTSVRCNINFYQSLLMPRVYQTLVFLSDLPAEPFLCWHSLWQYSIQLFSARDRSSGSSSRFALSSSERLGEISSASALFGFV